MILRRWLASLMTRLRGRAAEQEVDDELRTHLEMAVEENLARGMSEREATRVARRSLGVVSSIKEARRQADSLYWLDTLLQDLRYGVRILCRAPRFSVAVVFILGLGVGMTTAVFAIVDSLLAERRAVRRIAPPGGAAHAGSVRQCSAAAGLDGRALAARDDAVRAGRGVCPPGAGLHRGP